MMNSVRGEVKTLLSAGLHRFGVRHMLRAARSFQNKTPRVVFVAYHRVVEDFNEALKNSIPGLLISSKMLRRQLEMAHHLGFQFTSMDAALEVLSGQTESKKDLLVVTFDDAYADVFEHGLPVLRAMGLPAIMYVPTGLVGTGKRFLHDRLFHLVRAVPLENISNLQDAIGTVVRKFRLERIPLPGLLDELIANTPQAVLADAIMELERLTQDIVPPLPESGAIMNWGQLRKWSQAGLSIGAHTVNHSVLPLEAPAVQEREITASKECLEKETGIEIRHFAFCNGWYSKNVVGRLVQAGFKSAVTTEALPNHVGQDPLLLKRKVLWEKFSLDSSGQYSPALTACHLEDVFGTLRLVRPVSGLHPTDAP